MDNSLSDEKLVRNALGGDESAFSQLFDGYRQLVYSTAYRFLQNVEEAQDATQEIFIKIFRSLQNWDSGKSKFSTWIYQIAANHSIDSWRSRKRRAEFQLDENIERILREQAMSAPGRSPFIEMDQKESIALLRKCIDSLPDLQKKIFILRYFQDLKLIEIAEVENCNIGTVKTSLYRATKTVRKSLGRLRG